MARCRYFNNEWSILCRILTPNLNLTTSRFDLVHLMLPWICEIQLNVHPPYTPLLFIAAPRPRPVAILATIWDIHLQTLLRDIIDGKSVDWCFCLLCRPSHRNSVSFETHQTTTEEAAGTGRRHFENRRNVSKHNIARTIFHSVIPKWIRWLSERW